MNKTSGDLVVTRARARAIRPTIKDHNMAIPIKRKRQCHEIKARWHRTINKRLTDDKILATRIKQDKAHMQMVRATWEAAYRKRETSQTAG